MGGSPSHNPCRVAKERCFSWSNSGLLSRCRHYTQVRGPQFFQELVLPLYENFASKDVGFMILAGLLKRACTAPILHWGVFLQSSILLCSDNLIRTELLEHFMRDDLNKNAQRTMVVLRPLKVKALTNIAFVHENSVQNCWFACPSQLMIIYILEKHYCKAGGMREGFTIRRDSFSSIWKQCLSLKASSL